MRNAMCMAALCGKCAPDDRFWGARAPWCHLQHYEGSWTDASASATEEYLREKIWIDKEESHRAAKRQRRAKDTPVPQPEVFTALNNEHEVPYVHCTRCFVGFPPGRWQELRNTPGICGTGHACPQPGDCVPQHVRRSCGLDPSGHTAPTRYAGGRTPGRCARPRAS